MTILVANPKSIFIHVPKNAGTSISYWLRTNVGGRQVKRKHDTFDAIKQKYGQDLGFSFAVVRNPWDRVVSAFNYNKKEFASGRYDNLEEKLKFKKEGRTKRKYEGIKRQKDIILQDDFDLFVKKNILNPVEKLQVEMIQGVDVILFYENLQTDFDIIKNFYNIDNDLPLHNTSNHDNYRSYYVNETKDIIYRRFYTDIKKFNYEF